MKEWILGWEMFSLQVRQQILDMAVMFLCGVGISIVRLAEIRAVTRLRPAAVIAWLLEVLFWIGAGFFAAEFLYYCAYGTLSIHAFVALAGGFFFGKQVICRQIVTFAGSVFSRQDLTQCGIMKGSVVSGDVVGEREHGKDETKPYVQKRKRKQRHRYR